MRLEPIENSIVDDTIKGIPGGTLPFALREIGRHGWNLLRGDLPLPLLVLSESALANNSRWMRGFLSRTGTLLAPHGKTSMAPQLFARQLADGAWGITCATVSQLQVYRRFGVPRVLFANQLVGKQNVRWVLDELAADADFDFTCLVDSVEGAEMLARAVRDRGLARSLPVLLEVGAVDTRAGCRSESEALHVARHVRERFPHLTLRGVEGFEGIVRAESGADREREVSALLGQIERVTQACADENLFTNDEVLVSAGGSAFFDLVVRCLSDITSRRGFRLLLRSGCYLTHDSGGYESLYQEMVVRSEIVRTVPGALRPALELWCYVQSLPEPGLAVLSFGKRDAPYDIGLPSPRAWVRPGEMASPAPLDEPCDVVRLYDQHACMRVLAGHRLRVGDMVVCGVSHPCGAFEKWQLVMVINDAYDIVDGVRTYF